MDELKFVLRCFAFSAVILILTQLKTGDVSIEQRIQGSLMNSRMADFVNKVADGGVQLIKDVAVLGKSTYQDWQKSGAGASVQAKESEKTLQLNETEIQHDEVQAKNQQPNPDEEIELTEEEQY